MESVTRRLSRLSQFSKSVKQELTRNISRSSRLCANPQLSYAWSKSTGSDVQIDSSVIPPLHDTRLQSTFFLPARLRILLHAEASESSCQTMNQSECSNLPSGVTAPSCVFFSHLRLDRFWIFEPAKPPEPHPLTWCSNYTRQREKKGKALGIPTVLLSLQHQKIGTTYNTIDQFIQSCSPLPSPLLCWRTAPHSVAGMYRENWIQWDFEIGFGKDTANSKRRWGNSTTYMASLSDSFSGIIQSLITVKRDYSRFSSCQRKEFYGMYHFKWMRCENDDRFGDSLLPSSTKLTRNQSCSTN